MSVNSLPIRALSATHNLFTSVSGKARLSILIYHRVFKTIDPFQADVPDTQMFSWQMELLHRHYNVVSLSKAVEMLETGHLPARTACVTFDDGYADNYLHALPILKQWKIPATFFVASGFLNGGMMWNDIVLETIRQPELDQLSLKSVGLKHYPLSSFEQRQQLVAELLPIIKYMEPDQRNEVTHCLVEQANNRLPDNVMMNTEQLRQLHASSGMEIGAHTVSHPILSRLDDDQATHEISTGRQQLSELLDGAEIRYFAYPNGKPGQDFKTIHADIVKKLGFKAAVTTCWSSATTESNLYQLPRFTPWDKSPVKFSVRLMKNAISPYQ